MPRLRALRRFKNILFACTPDAESESAWLETLHLAERNGAGVKAFSVLPHAPSRHPSQRPGGEFDRACYAAWQESLESLLESGRKRRGKAVQFVQAVGIPFLEIIREVMRGEHDLVVIGMSPGAGIHTWSVGHTAKRLIRKCPCPVWVIKPPHDREVRAVLAAVDPVSLEPDAATLNRTILELATSLAEGEKARLDVVHSWHHWGEELIRGRSSGDVSRLQEVLKEEEEYHRGRFRALIEQDAGSFPRRQTHFVKGDPSTVIPRMVSNLQSDVLVMGSVCRTGLAGFLLGSTAEHVLNHVECTLLAVKPDGFQSPVSLGG